MFTENELTLKEIMYNKKQWDSEVLTRGGISFYKLESIGKKYKISVTSKDNKIILKWRIKTANGEIFSISAKTSSEAQNAVDCLYGKNKYTVSMMLI